MGRAFFTNSMTSITTSLLIVFARIIAGACLGRKFNRVVSGILTALSIVTAASLAYAQPYTATDLGTLGGTRSSALGINNAGTVVGSSTTAGDVETHAISYSNGVINDLGTLGGTYGSARAINDAGTVVGVSSVTGTSPSYSFISNSDGSIHQPSGPAGNIFTAANDARAVNDEGTVAGSFVVSSGYSHAYIYSNGSMQDLGTLGGNNSYATGINGNDFVVGYASTAGNAASHAFVNGLSSLQDLGTLGGTNSYATAINGAGTIIGRSNILGSATSVTHAFSYSNGSMEDLGTLGGTTSSATAINSGGIIVGYSYVSGGTSHAFVYSDGVMYDLNWLVNLPGVTLTAANGINDLQQIVASGSNGRAYLLNFAAIPEPSTYAGLFGLAALGFAALRRRFRRAC